MQVQMWVQAIAWLQEGLRRGRCSATFTTSLAVAAYNTLSNPPPPHHALQHSPLLVVLLTKKCSVCTVQQAEQCVTRQD